MPVVLLAARMLWDKGGGEFVEAARRLRGRARFVLVGAVDSDNPACVPQSILQEWQNEGAVELWGGRSDMAKVFALANVVCLPSYREGLPKVLIEAMSVGRACVTTDVPGCRDCVAHGENGFLVPPKDIGALVEAIVCLLDDQDLRRRMGLQSRLRAEQEFSMHRVNEQTQDVYRLTLGDGA